MLDFKVKREIYFYSLFIILSSKFGWGTESVIFGRKPWWNDTILFCSLEMDSQSCILPLSRSSNFNPNPPSSLRKQSMYWNGIFLYIFSSFTSSDCFTSYFIYVYKFTGLGSRYQALQLSVCTCNEIYRYKKCESLPWRLHLKVVSGK